MKFLYYLFSIPLCLFLAQQAVSKSEHLLKELAKFIQGRPNFADFFYGKQKRASIETAIKMSIRSSDSLFVSDVEAYKYFTFIYSETLHMNQLYGVDHIPILEKLLNSLSQDKIFEDLYMEHLKSDLMQFLFLSLTIIGFVSFAFMTLGLELKLTILVPILMLHSLGLFSYIVIFLSLREYHFRSPFKLYSSLQLFQALLCVECSIDETLSRCSILGQDHKGDIKIIYDSLMLDIKSYSEQGYPIESSVTRASLETWGIIKRLQEQLYKMQGALKLLNLFVFYLSSYILSIYYIVNQMEI